MSEKRKASGPPDAEAGSRSAKRVKAGDATETPESTLEKGRDFIRTIKASKDKTGRSIIDEFLTLPDAKQVPGYYDQIKLPLAIDTIEDKLNNLQYANLTALESDFKRMVQNAKDFNDKRSLIFEDAERVRKGASNWFVRHNPAYNDRNYVAKPTPLPGEVANGTPGTPAPVSLKITNKSAPVRTPAASATPAPVNGVDEERDAEGEVEEASGAALGDFKGKSFQKAQEQLINELIEYQDPESELEIFTPFHFLPPRTLADYYDLIKKPVSLKAIQKQVIGKVGRAPPTGISAFQSWDHLEDELSYIWQNCREYNEDGSDMYNLAGEFEEICRQRITLARKQVPAPKGTTIKLNMSAQPPQPPKNTTIKLKLGGGTKASPSPAPVREKTEERGTPGIVVDGDALQRQRDMVSASVNGRPASSSARNPFGGATAPRSQSATTPIPTLAKGVSPAPAQTNGVKAEGQSPALSAVRPMTGQGQAPLSMPPPVGVTSRPVSGSPHPQGVVNGVGGAVQAPITQQAYQPPPAANNFVQSKLRPKGSSVKTSILPTLTLSSHPSLPGAPWSRTIKAHPRLIEQSVTFTVPANKHTLHIAPEIPPAVLSRAYRIWVHVDGRRVSARPVVEGEKRGPGGGMVFEARLERGAVGRIEVEVLAEKARARAIDGDEDESRDAQVEREKVTAFVHVVR